jgi:hypothetical protein
VVVVAPGEGNGEEVAAGPGVGTGAEESLSLISPFQHPTQGISARP